MIGNVFHHLPQGGERMKIEIKLFKLTNPNQGLGLIRLSQDIQS